MTVGEQQNLFLYLKESLGRWDIVKNVFESFFFYFLRFLCGFWDTTEMGLLAGFSTVGLFLVCFHKNKRLQDNLLLLFLLFVILMRAVLLPNSYGVQSFIMSPQATFASFLYFSYYYTYPDAALMILIFGLQINRTFIKNQRNFIVIFALVTVILLSSVMHLFESVKDTLEYHSFYFTNQNVIPSINLFVKEYSQLKESPLYLSFPSGSNKRFARIGKKTLGSMDLKTYKSPLLMEYFNYCTIISVKFLRTIEEGRLIVSLDNVAAIKFKYLHNELAEARYFYDVYKNEVFDLNVIEGQKGKKNLYPLKI